MSDDTANLPPDAKKRKHGDDLAELDEKEEKPEKSTRYYNSSADLEILSADGKLLRIHSYHLLARSSVFRHMLSTTNGDRLELTDTVLETEEILAGLLDLITDGHFDTSANLTTNISIIRLANKYELETAISRVLLKTRYDLSKDHNLATEAFAIGAALNSSDLCKTAFQTGGHWYENFSDPERWGETLDGGLVLDPGCAPLELLESMTIPTIWVWLRSFRKAFGPPGLRDDEPTEKYQAMSEEFLRLMALKDAPQSLA